MCKCGSETYDNHIKKVFGGFPGHVYKGSVWLTSDYCVVCDGPCQNPASHKPYEVNHG